ncbi:NAD(P)H-dependent oxidoreductase [Pseudomonas sp. RIT-PI-S]|uniref:FMN-dependent NADH-azoreductase n=1 Tax=Pseudomonas sp. RIT-PI-S TaxID=3035295 RepID=UPI0021DB52DA|nr:NAD(P)H-dependent oxidoreductase [Pseudomonas sp. RIT-PI-S]
MRNVLLINASPRPAVSQAHQLAHELLGSLQRRHPALALTERDLAGQPLAPLGADYANALTTPTPFDAPELKLSEALIVELERSDLVLIATPMHNFTLPAALKLWIDYVLRIHRTFSYGADGKVGLLPDRPVYVLVGSGGFHRGERARQPDFLTPYLRHALATMGLFDVHFIYLEGLVGEAAAVTARAAARAQLALEPIFQGLVVT